MIILKTTVPFNQLSSSLSDSLKRLLSSSKSMSALFPRSRQCTQQIWNIICIALAILGICIMTEKLSVGMWRMYIHTPGWHTIYFITFISVSVTWCRRRHAGWRWRSGRRCRRFWWGCTSSFAPPACLRILSFAILAFKAAIRMIFINHCRVSLCRSLHRLVPRNLNSSLLLFLDFGAKFLN